MFCNLLPNTNTVNSLENLSKKKKKEIDVLVSLNYIVMGKTYYKQVNALHACAYIYSIYTYMKSVYVLMCMHIISVSRKCYEET